MDLPGYGYAKVSFSEKKRWAELVEGYFQQPRDISFSDPIGGYETSPYPGRYADGFFPVRK